MGITSRSQESLQYPDEHAHLQVCVSTYGITPSEEWMAVGMVVFALVLSYRRRAFLLSHAISTDERRLAASLTTRQTTSSMSLFLSNSLRIHATVSLRELGSGISRVFRLINLSWAQRARTSCGAYCLSIQMEHPLLENEMSECWISHGLQEQGRVVCGHRASPPTCGSFKSRVCWPRQAQALDLRTVP